MILGIVRNPFRETFRRVVLKCLVLCGSFRDCITLCQGMPNIFQLNFEGSSKGSERHLFLEDIQCKRVRIEDLVRAKVRIDKILVES
jgi:hypothetical protein